MKTTNAKKPVFQGDLMVRRIAKRPADVTLSSSNVVAHSETGHHHVAERARVWNGADPLKCYVTPIEGAESIDLVHQRAYDTHEPVRLLWDAPVKDEEVVYEITRQREWAPEGWRQVRD